MAADDEFRDEFRKVGEDIGALARSLARDFREAVDQAVRGGYGPGGAVRHGLRGLSDEAKRGVRAGFSGARGRRRGYWGPWGCGPGHSWWRGPPWPPPDPPGVTGAPGPPTSQFVGRPVAGPTWHRPPRTRPPFPPVRHRWDATTVFGLLAVLFGVAWLISALGALHVSVEGVVAVGLMLLGASLVVTGRTDWSLSRRSWPMLIGVGLIGVLVVTSTTFGLGSELNSISFGNKTVGVTFPSGTVHGGFGNLSVTVPSLTSSETLKVVSIAGDTTITLPTNASVNLDARVFGGQICVNGKRAANGLAAETHQNYPAASGSPTLTLHVRQMFGQIMIGVGGCSQR